MLWTLIIGCKGVDEVPLDFEGAVFQLWRAIEDGDEAMVTAMNDLIDVVEPSGNLEYSDGSVNVLTQDDVEMVGVSRDADKASGIVMTNKMVVCDMEMLREILVYPHQDDVLGDYKAFHREYHSSREDFLAYTSPRVEWQNQYTVGVLGSDYDAVVEGRLQTVEASLESVVYRQYMPEPADFGGSNKSMDQDYQLEVWMPVDGVLVHVYAMWREANFGAGFSSDDEGVQRTVLNGLKSWDDDMEELCKEGLP